MEAEVLAEQDAEQDAEEVLYVLIIPHNLNVADMALVDIAEALDFEGTHEYLVTQENEGPYFLNRFRALLATMEESS